MVKAIIFDFDDTLINTLATSVEHHQLVAKDMGYAIDMNKYYECWGLPWPDFIAQVIPGVKFQQFYQKYNELMKKNNLIYPRIIGSDITLKKLKSMNLTLGLLSSSIKDNILLRADLAEIPLNLMDDELFFCFDTTHTHKPDPDVFRDALIVLTGRGVKKDEIVYVGDHVNDYLAAKNAGLRFIGVTTGLHKKQDFIDLGLDSSLVLESVEYLPEKIEEMKIMTNEEKEHGTGIS